MPSMHGLSIKAVTDLIRVLPVGFLTLFSTDACCTAVGTEKRSALDDSLEEQLQSISISSDESDNTPPHSTPKPRVFKDTTGRFTTFMEDSRISEIINEYFKRKYPTQNEDYPNIEDEIYEVVAMDLYCICSPTGSAFLSEYELLNEDGSPTENLIEELKAYLWDSNVHKSKFKTIAVSGFEFDHTPTKAWKFLIDHCGTEELCISEIAAIDIAAFNSPDLSKIKELYLTSVGLTEIPCLYNLKGLERLYLDDNKIVEVSLQSYFDAETHRCNAMPDMKYLRLDENDISSIDGRIEEVFPHPSMKIDIDEVVLHYPLGDVKEKLEGAGIELTEPDLESRMDWMPVTD
ncbi:uncharacterized protein VICG_00618 [Vittaforma corneae ATCC 50505]|uniref:Leucine-rich repeat domain-containing protein n=1 Tax=Vittaforma corneae (strain ATCC 50505) TaxID=993615 RepID=L2GNM9_VITCO|nr:uncharacterized protein VICG_00618 [Vittaforma corneae ATCC 50505]ELA42219.1 hypothetical protein VICG_00618 [Vittaforma corneae ATCC 50505]